MIKLTGNYCGWPPVPVNGHLTGEFKVGSTSAAYQCDQRFFQTVKQSKCNTTTGLWTDLPRCICPAPDSPLADFTRLNATHGKLECKSFYSFIGFGIDGSEIMTCKHTSGSWNTIPECN